MPEPEIQPEPRAGKIKDLEARIQALEKTVKAILQFAKETEKYTGEELMPEGEYHGTRFE